jgi:hypothetical protein
MTTAGRRGGRFFCRRRAYLVLVGVVVALGILAGRLVAGRMLPPEGATQGLKSTMFHGRPCGECTR